MDAADDDPPPIADKRSPAHQQPLDIIEFLPGATFVIDLSGGVVELPNA